MKKNSYSEQRKLQIQTNREMSIFKRDDMIQKARYSLTIQEQRCILYATSKIKPTDDIFQEYSFELKDLYDLCGLQGDSYTELKTILLKLKQKTWWIEIAPGVESTISWFNKVRINKHDGKITIRFDDDMMPYLLRIAEKGSFYTSYSLQYVLPMSSQYSPRLYELLKSYQKNNREWFFELEELKRLMNCENYTRWPDFRRFALIPAIEEINRYTDLNVAYDTQKEGRKTTRVIFYMANKDKKALLVAKKAGTKKLDGDIDLNSFIMEAKNENNIKQKFFKENPIK